MKTKWAKKDLEKYPFLPTFADIVNDDVAKEILSYFHDTLEL